MKHIFPYFCLAVICYSYHFSCVHPENLYQAKERVVAYYESGCFTREVEAVVHRAIRAFTSVDLKGIVKPAVVFDIDETVLSEYCNFKSIQFGYIPKLSHEWVLRASAPAMPAVKQLYDFLLQQRYHLIFLTGRQYDEYEATYNNLTLRGFTGFDRLIVRQPSQKSLSAVLYKAGERAKLVAEGYTILGCVGDQWSDMEGGNAGMFVKIPNYAYIIH